MTARERLIAKKVLNHLHELDGGQATVLEIHASIGGMTLCSAAELDAVLELLDTQRFVLFVPARFSPTVKKFNLTDAGAAARLQL